MTNGLVVVTGAPRSGTSWMVQQIAKLGIPPVARPFLKEHRKIRHMNQGGFYDSKLFDVLLAKMRRACIKVWGGLLSFVSPSKVSFVIVCQRNRDDTIRSYGNLLKELGWLFPKWIARVVVDIHLNAIKKWCLTTDIPYRIVDMDNISDEVMTSIGREICQ